MIKIGLTGFGDHEELYGKLTQAKRLPTYSEHFPIVELDSPFYAVQPVKNYLKWVNDTPKDFGFIVKAYQGMTGHLRGKKNFLTPRTLCTKHSTSLSNRLSMPESLQWLYSNIRPGSNAVVKM